MGTAPKLILCIVLLCYPLLCFSQKDLFSTQIDITAGTSRILRQDQPGIGFSSDVKCVYQLMGNIYVDAGLGTTYFNSQPLTASPELLNTSHTATALYIPAGIGFNMEDDRAGIICGIDELTAIYPQLSHNLLNQTKIVLGLSPEFGFNFKIGRANQKGFNLGLIGKLQLLQSPLTKEGPGLKYGFFGIGTLITF